MTILFASMHAQREPTKNSLSPFWIHSGQLFFDQPSSSSVFTRAFEKLGINIILPQNLWYGRGRNTQNIELS